MHDPSTFLHHFSPLTLSAVEIVVILLVYTLHFLCDFFKVLINIHQTQKETIISDTMVILNCPSIPVILIPPLKGYH